MNENPLIHTIVHPRTLLTFKDNLLSNVTELTIFELIRDIIDPEHPQTIEQLKIVDLENIKIFNDTEKILNYEDCIKNIVVYFKPTISHCSMASLIGLSIKVQLVRYISKEYCIKVLVMNESHEQEVDLNKQLNDKDRVNAAMENESVMNLVNDALPDMSKWGF